MHVRTRNGMSQNGYGLRVIMNRHGHNNIRNEIVWVQTSQRTSTCTVSLHEIEPRPHQKFESSAKKIHNDEIRIRFCELKTKTTEIVRNCFGAWYLPKDLLHLHCHLLFFLVWSFWTEAPVSRSPCVTSTGDIQSSSRFPVTLSASRLDESCDGDVEDEILSEFMDNPSTIRKYKIVCFADDTLSAFGQSWLFTAGPLIRVSVVFAKLPQRQDCGRVVE